MAEQNGEKDIVHLQLGLLEDTQGLTLQRRFEEFCQAAADRLTMVDPRNGEPVFDAGTVKAELDIKVQVERIANDALSFRVVDAVKSKFPHPPGKARSTMLVQTIGFAQRVTRGEQISLLEPDRDQPQPMTPAEAERKLGGRVDVRG